MSRKRADLKLVSLAIEEAGSIDTGTVSLQLEKILDREMVKWPSYQKMSRATRYSALCGRLERLGICTSSDIQRLIEEAKGA
ncbi:MAG TPA: hypothetical protein DCZ10_15940 [Pelotomaculum sp.]|nr:hypothetical protein [Pelotomaculum sp.]